jgi:hypothetical protein
MLATCKNASEMQKKMQQWLRSSGFGIFWAFLVNVCRCSWTIIKHTCGDVDSMLCVLATDEHTHIMKLRCDSGTDFEPRHISPVEIASEINGQQDAAAVPTCVPDVPRPPKKTRRGRKRTATGSLATSSMQNESSVSASAADTVGTSDTMQWPRWRSWIHCTGKTLSVLCAQLISPSGLDLTELIHVLTSEQICIPFVSDWFGMRVSVMQLTVTKCPRKKNNCFKVDTVLVFCCPARHTAKSARQTICLRVQLSPSAWPIIIKNLGVCIIRMGATRDWLIKRLM